LKKYLHGGKRNYYTAIPIVFGGASIAQSQMFPVGRAFSAVPNVSDGTSI